MLATSIVLSSFMLLTRASTPETNSTHEIIEESSNTLGRQLGFGPLPGAYPGMFPLAGIGPYAASSYPGYGSGGGYPTQTLTHLTSYPGSSFYQNQYGAGSLPGSTVGQYSPNLNQYIPPIFQPGSYYPSSGTYRPPSSGLIPTNLNPSYGYNPMGVFNNNSPLTGLYPTNSNYPSSSGLTYKPVSPVISGQNAYPTSGIIPDPFSFQGPSYSPSSTGVGYKPNPVSASYNPVSSQQSYKPIVIEATPGSYGSSIYNSPSASQQYKPITVIDSSYTSGSNSYRPSSSGAYEGYDSVTITASPYGGTSPYRPSSIYNSPTSSYGSNNYKDSTSRPIAQASIQELSNKGPLFYPSLKSDDESSIRSTPDSSAGQVTFPME